LATIPRDATVEDGGRDPGDVDMVGRAYEARGNRKLVIHRRR
jgi:hypothetical protein